MDPVSMINEIIKEYIFSSLLKIDKNCNTIDKNNPPPMKLIQK